MIRVGLIFGAFLVLAAVHIIGRYVFGFTGKKFLRKDEIFSLEKCNSPSPCLHRDCFGNCFLFYEL
jgi:hypothetical protein